MNRKTFFKAIAGSIVATFSTIPIFTSKANTQKKKSIVIDDDIEEIIINSTRGSITIYENVDGKEEWFSWLSNNGNKNIQITYTKSAEGPKSTKYTRGKKGVKGDWGEIGSRGIQGDIGPRGLDYPH